jgi:hypothetical protein
MRLTEANGAPRRRDLELINDFPALPDRPAKPEAVQQAAVFRIYPNQSQEQAFRQWAGAGRWFWNKCVEINRQLYAQEDRFAFHDELSALLPQMKRDHAWPWLAEPPAIHLVDVSRRLDTALRDFLDDRRAVREGRKTAVKAKDFPKFKSKHDRDVSIYLPGSALKLIRREAAASDKARGWIERRGHGPERASGQVRGRRGPGRVAAPVGLQEPLARSVLRQARPVRRQHADLLGVRASSGGQREADAIRPQLDLSVLRHAP